jgi:hypothetical protein
MNSALPQNARLWLPKPYANIIAVSLDADVEVIPSDDPGIIPVVLGGKKLNAQSHMAQRSGGSPTPNAKGSEHTTRFPIFLALARISFGKRAHGNMAKRRNWIQ